MYLKRIVKLPSQFNVLRSFLPLQVPTFQLYFTFYPLGYVCVSVLLIYLRISHSFLGVQRWFQFHYFISYFRTFVLLTCYENYVCFVGERGRKEYEKTLLWHNNENNRESPGLTKPTRPGD